MPLSPTVPGFGNRVKRAIEHSDADLSAVALAARIDRRTLERYMEREEPPNRPANVEAVARILGVRPQWLNTGDGEMEADNPAAAYAGPQHPGAAKEPLADYLSRKGIHPHSGAPEEKATAPRFTEDGRHILFIYRAPDGTELEGLTRDGAVPLGTAYGTIGAATANG